MSNLLRFRKSAVLTLLLLSSALAARPQTKVTVNAVFPPLSYMPLPGTQYANDFMTYVMTSKLVDGVNPPLFWSMVDKGPGAPGGQYDWSEYEAVIQPYIKAGKKVNVLVWSISESGPNNFNYANHATPAYVMNQAQSVVCSTFPGDGTQAGRYPVVWDPNFQNNYEKFITQVLKHFHGNTHIGYIRFGLFGGAAVYPYCQDQLEAYMPSGQSFLQTAVDYYTQIMSYIRSQGPTMPVIAPFAAYDSQISWSEIEASVGIANSLGLGYQGLRSSDITSFPNCSGDWCNLFLDYSPVNPLPPFELQTVGQSDPSGTCTPSCFDGAQQQTGALPPLLSFAVNHDTRIFEIYANDLLLALDPNYPGYSEYHTLYQKGLSAVHTGKGSSMGIEPLALKFGNVATGAASETQSITLTNNGTSPITFNSITVSGNFAESNNCTAQKLAAKHQCSISVMFKTETLGRQSGLLTITSSDPWSPQAIGLSGVGVK